jgi:hypothetical protein
MRPQKAWVAIIHWADGSVEDADELRVFAETAEVAKSLAAATWTATKGAEWRHCRIVEIKVFAPARLSAIA